MLGRQLRFAAGFLDLPLLWWGHRIGIWCPPPRTSLHRLRQEVQVGVLRLSGPSSLHSGGGALQCRSLNPQHHRTFRLHISCRQRCRLRYLSQQVGHSPTGLFPPEPTHCSSRVIHYVKFALRRRSQRRPPRVPDESGPLSAHPLSVGQLRPRHIRQQSRARRSQGTRPDLSVF